MSAKEDKRIRQRLAWHNGRMQELIAEGMDKTEASAQAYRELTGEIPAAPAASDSLLTARHYQDALDVQNACNLSGVVFSFAAAMKTICDESTRLGKGTAWKNTHPIAVMYACKIADLTRADSLYSPGPLGAAMDACVEGAKS